MKKVKVKKIFLGHISIRDYIIKKCLVKKQGIVVDFNGKKMSIPYEQLKNKFQFHQQKFLSKFSSKKYELIDFKFIPDEMNQMRLF